MVWPVTGSVIIGRPVSQHDDIGRAPGLDVCDASSGLIAPTLAVEEHPGLVEAFGQCVGDWLLDANDCVPPDNN